jgi:hypothetical protein
MRQAQIIHKGKMGAIVNSTAARAKLLANTRTLDANLLTPHEFYLRSGAGRGLSELASYAA